MKSMISSKKDLAIAGALVLILYLLLLFLFPYLWAGACPSTATDDCTIIQIEPFPFFELFTYIIPVGAGLLFYFIRNKFNLQQGAIILVILVLLRVIIQMILLNI